MSGSSKTHVVVPDAKHPGGVSPGWYLGSRDDFKDSSDGLVEVIKYLNNVGLYYALSEVTPIYTGLIKDFYTQKVGSHSSSSKELKTVVRNQPYSLTKEKLADLLKIKRSGAKVIPHSDTPLEDAVRMGYETPEDLKKKNVIERRGFPIKARFLVDVTKKCIISVDFAINEVTRKQLDLMLAIYDEMDIDWSYIIFNLLRDYFTGTQRSKFYSMGRVLSLLFRAEFGDEALADEECYKQSSSMKITGEIEKPWLKEMEKKKKIPTSEKSQGSSPSPSLALGSTEGDISVEISDVPKIQKKKRTLRKGGAGDGASDEKVAPRAKMGETQVTISHPSAPKRRRDDSDDQSFISEKAKKHKSSESGSRSEKVSTAPSEKKKKKKSSEKTLKALSEKKDSDVIAPPSTQQVSVNSPPPVEEITLDDPVMGNIEQEVEPAQTTGGSDQTPVLSTLISPTAKWSSLTPSQEASTANLVKELCFDIPYLGTSSGVVVSSPNLLEDQTQAKAALIAFVKSNLISKAYHQSLINSLLSLYPSMDKDLKEAEAVLAAAYPISTSDQWEVVAEDLSSELRETNRFSLMLVNALSQHKQSQASQNEPILIGSPAERPSDEGMSDAQNEPPLEIVGSGSDVAVEEPVQSAQEDQTPPVSDAATKSLPSDSDKGKRPQTTSEPMVPAVVDSHDSDNEDPTQRLVRLTAAEVQLEAGMTQEQILAVF